jgi:predicted nicotinamide N-methyase
VAGLAAARQGADVVVTDLPEMIPLLSANIGANSLNARAQALPLRWGDAYDLDAALEHGPFDMVIGSDILYAPERFDELLDTVVALTAPGAVVALAYPRRFTEGLFLAEAEAYFDVLAWEDEIDTGVFVTRLQRRDEARRLYV